MFMLILLSLAGYCCYLAQRYNWPMAAMPFFAVSMITSVLYICALLEILPLATWVIFCGGLFGFFYSSIRFPKQLLNQLLTPAFIVFSILFVAIYFKVNHATFWSWDEFSQWGTISKEIFINKGIFIKNVMHTCPDYPPGPSMFHYFVYRATGFSDGATYFAQDIMTISALMCFLIRCPSWRYWPLIGSSILLSYLLLFTFGTGFATVYIDVTLGVFFGMAIVSYILAQEKDSAVIRLIPVVFCLPILKAAGGLLGGVVVLIVLFDYVRQAFSKNGNNANAPTEKTNVDTYPSSKSWLFWLRVCLLPLALLISITTWHQHIETQKIKPTFHLSITPEGVKKMASMHQTKELLTSFGHSLASRAVGAADEPLLAVVINKTVKPLSVLDWSLILICLTILGIFANKDKRTRSELWVCGILLILGAVVYYLGILYLYLVGSYITGEWAYSMSIPCLERFGGIYFLGWSLAVYSYFLRAVSEKHSTFPLLLGMIGFFVLTIYAVSSGSYSYLINSPKSLEDTQKPVLQIIEQFTAKVADEGKAYVIVQDSSGFEGLVTRYKLLPRLSNSSCSNISTISTPDKCLMSVENWVSFLKDYDYLILIKSDDTFWQQYGDLFKNVNAARKNNLFKIEHLAQNKIQFVAI